MPAKNPARVPDVLARLDPVGTATGGGPGVSIRSASDMDDSRKVKTTGTYTTEAGDSFFFRAGDVFPGDAEFTLGEAAKEPEPAARAEPAAPQNKAMPAAPQTKSER